MEKLVEKVEPRIWCPESLPEPNPQNWPSQNPEADLIAFYGEVNTRQERIDLPYPHKLWWDKRTVVHRVTCRELVADSMRTVLANVLDQYGLREIKRLRLDLWGGCLTCGRCVAGIGIRCTTGGSPSTTFRNRIG